MPTPSQIAWAAGFFEGEGSIGRHNSGGGRGMLHGYRISIANSDLDMLERFIEIFDAGAIYHANFGTNKTMWQWVCTRRVDVERIMVQLEPWLSDRRRERWEELQQSRASIIARRAA